jgi:iron complex transport system substrate-binding protein
MIDTTRTITDARTLDALACRAPAIDDLLELAAWLGDHGTTHLSHIERMELAERLITRRRFLIGAGGLALGALTGCGAPEKQASAPMATVASVGYPRIVIDAAGRSVPFDKRPERVVLTTFVRILDEVLLLDVAPLAYSAWLGERLPIWTQQTIDGLGLKIINLNGQAYPDPLNFEQLSALQPDLIVLLSVDGTAESIENFALFEQIGPVFIVDFFAPSYDRLQMLAEIFAVEAKMDAIRARDAALLAMVTAPPADAELVVCYGYANGGAYGASIYNGGQQNSMWLLEQAGFRLKDFGRPMDEEFFDISEENFAMLEADMLWNVSPAADGSPDIENSTIFQNLEVVKAGRYRALNRDQSIAVLDWTPLATPFLVETLNELVASYDVA